MVDGMMNKKIAEKLGASVNTIKTHRAEIFRKMAATSLLDLVRKIGLLRGAGEPAAPPQAAPPAASETSAPARPHSLRVIVVEDNGFLRQATVTGLNALGHQARGARDGAELDREFEAAPADIVLLDIGLGKDREDGFAIAARLQRHARCGIVMVTARGEMEARIRALEESVDAYLVKPVDFGELSAVMASVMRRLRPAAGPV